MFCELTEMTGTAQNVWPKWNQLIFVAGSPAGDGKSRMSLFIHLWLDLSWSAYFCSTWSPSPINSTQSVHK